MEVVAICCNVDLDPTRLSMHPLFLKAGNMFKEAGCPPFMSEHMSFNTAIADSLPNLGFRPHSATYGLVLIDRVFATCLLWFDVPGMVMMLGLALRQLRLQIQWLDGKGGNQFKSSNHWICCVNATAMAHMNINLCHGWFWFAVFFRPVFATNLVYIVNLANLLRLETYYIYMYIYIYII